MPHKIAVLVGIVLFIWATLEAMSGDDAVKIAKIALAMLTALVVSLFLP